MDSARDCSFEFLFFVFPHAFLVIPDVAVIQEWHCPGAEPPSHWYFLRHGFVPWFVPFVVCRKKSLCTWRLRAIARSISRGGTSCSFARPCERTTIAFPSLGQSGS